MKRLLLSILLLSVSMLVGCGGGSNSGGGGGGGNPTLVSIQVTPANRSVTLGATPATQQFTATGTFSDNTTRDLTASASWSSSATTVATVSAGLATGVAAGTTTISASSAGVSGSTVLTVNSAALVSIAVTPATATVAPGGTQQFKATGTYADGSTQDITSTVQWSANQGSTITAGGLATGVTPGTNAQIAAAIPHGGIVGFATLTVTNPLQSITVTPANPSVVVNHMQQFAATGTFADGSTKDITGTVAWSASAGASITAGGLATAGSAAGASTITATSGSISGTTTLTITNPLVSITVTPTNPSAAPGTKPQFTATGLYADNTSQNITASVTWTSSSTAVATINNAAGLQGQATAVAPGTTTITATQGSVSGSTALTVTNATVTKIDVSPQSAPISLGVQQQYTALGTFSDGSQQDITNIVTWSSSDTTRVTITSSGLATGVAVTTTPVTIKATYQGLSGTATVTVDSANLVSIAITPGNITLAQGTSRQFIATGTLNNGSTLNITNQTTWTTSDPTLATVGPPIGRVRAAASVASSSNPVTITATLGAVSQQVTVNVTNATPTAITVTPISPTIQPGSTQVFSATGTFSDSTQQDITLDANWLSSDTTVATVTFPGRLLGNAAGVAAITASFGGQTGTAQLTVSSATLVSISITPVSYNLAPGSSITYQANGVYSDNSTALLSSLVTWATSNSSVASITTGGVVTGQSAGTATITASYQGVTSNNGNILVTASPLVSVAVAPLTATVPEGVSTQFNAIGTFADTSTQLLTASVNWASTSPAVGTISNAFGRQGVATGVGAGQSTITGVFAGKTGSATLTVTNATLKSIAVTPPNPTIPQGAVQQFLATGTFSDGSVIDLTNQVNWTSSNATFATINNIGQASAASPGTTTITATFTQNGVPTSGSATLIVQ